MRRKVIAGNWKMNMTPSQAVKLVTELRPNVNNPDVDVVFCVPSIDIVPVVEAVKGSNIHIGAENVYYQEKGAFTGELSPEMLVDAGVSHVIIGHSERREYFGETDETVNKKIKATFRTGLKPIVCVGETLNQKEEGKATEVITTQTRLALESLTNEQVEHTIIAYEPIWAIGTGKTATAEDANNSIKEIRQEIAKNYGQETASRVIIQYGGSVKAVNAKELFSMSDIDGALVGGASLNVEEFSKIINYNK